MKTNRRNFIAGIAAGAVTAPLACSAISDVLGYGKDHGLQLALEKTGNATPRQVPILDARNGLEKGSTTIMEYDDAVASELDRTISRAFDEFTDETRERIANGELVWGKPKVYNPFVSPSVDMHFRVNLAFQEKFHPLLTNYHRITSFGLYPIGTEKGDARTQVMVFCWTTNPEEKKMWQRASIITFK